jgi:transcription initiation factor IIE alpha subunit
MVKKPFLGQRQRVLQENNTGSSPALGGDPLYNERKLVVLNFALQQNGFNADELAAAFSLDAHNARMLMLKYTRQKLFTRHKTKGVFRYYISEKGRDRLRYFANTMPEIFEVLTS